MIILDTNTLSALMQTTPDPAVVAWLDRQASRSIRTTAVTAFEIETGLSRLPQGRRREGLRAAFERTVTDDLAGRVLPLDEAAARLAGEFAARRQQRGLNVDALDSQIAGIALAHGAQIATRNVRHFADAGIGVVNPWQEGA